MNKLTFCDNKEHLRLRVLKVDHIHKKKSVVKKGNYLDMKKQINFHRDHQKDGMQCMYDLYLCLMWQPKTKKSVMSNDNEEPFCTAECMH